MDAPLDNVTALRGVSPDREHASLTGVRSNFFLRFVAHRLLALVGVLAVLVCAVFAMVQLIPGDPAASALGADATPAEIAQVRHANGWDEPFFEQFGHYVAGLAHGDLGRSFGQLNEPVSHTISRAFGPTLELAGFGLLVTLAFGLLIGMLAGALTHGDRHRRFDVAFGATASLLGALPEFLTATVLVFVFAVHFRLLPVAGAGSLKQLVLPVAAVSLHPTMVLARIVRVETLDVLARDYVRTARGQRLPTILIYRRHVLPNVLAAALTVGGLTFAALIGGTIVVETIFARPGLGTELVAAVLAKQYAPVQGITLVLGTAVVVMNALVDIVLAIVDPRLRSVTS